MNQYELLVETLRQFHSPQWINQYFDLLKKLLIELNLENDDPRLAMSLRKDKSMPVNIGQRWILFPKRDQYVHCIVPAEFAEEAVNGTLIGYFSPKSTRDAKWIEVSFLEGSQFPQVLYNACVDACMDILRRTKKSGFRKFHSSLVYDFTMESAVRNEVLNELKKLLYEG